MMSVFSESAPREIKVHYAFKVFGKLAKKLIKFSIKMLSSNPYNVF